MAHPSQPIENVVAALRGSLAGDIRQDALFRALYATDASIYELIPDAVVLPRNVADVIAAVRACGRFNVPITARGAGTGLSGGAVNRGVQLDCSRYLTRILEFDPGARTVRVEPGVVLDELNAALAPHGLYFPPDVATSSRATIGGMIANNSCGAHSVLTGRTVDHLRGVDVVLADGSRCTWGVDQPPPDNPLAQACDRGLARLAKEHAAEIAARYPNVLRRNAGYGLDRIHPREGRVNTEALLCGSEGTLGIIVGATLELAPLPRHKALLVSHYRELLPALGEVPGILRHRPAAVELIDRFILEPTRGTPAMARRRWFLEGDPAAILVTELFADQPHELAERLAALRAELKAGAGYAWRIITDPRQQADVWEVRKAGLGLSMSRPGDEQPYSFVEDTAVDPARLREYITRFAEVLGEEGVQEAGYYAHASVGCLHVRPVLNLKRREDVQRLRRVAARISALAVSFGGTLSGEHGDGLARSEFLGALFGPRLLGAFDAIKRTFDPQGLLNPGKIVHPPRMNENLRYGDSFVTRAPETILDFSVHGGMAGLAAMCSGVGQCRQRLVGTMCPSYMATGAEEHSTRARANALRLALSNRGLLDGLADPALDEVFDLCIACKACRTECPTGTDVARLKTEWLAHRNALRGVPRRSRLVAATPKLARWGSRLAPVSNWVLRSRPARALLELGFGLDRRVPPPAFARPTFRTWFAHRRTRPNPPDDAPAVVYFTDTWTNFHTPAVGIAAVRILEALGRTVVVPPTVCCGRPQISKGLLEEARELAARNIAVLAPLAERGLPILASEPSCLSAMLDEWPQLVRTAAAARVAAAAQGVDTFVAAALTARPEALRFAPAPAPVLYHGHCHQKALAGTADALALLAASTGGRVREIDSGCCGMAGAFGHEVEHYEVARAIGEQRLFPAVRGRGDAVVVVSGFSCREHITQHTGVRPVHVLEHVAQLLCVT